MSLAVFADFLKSRTWRWFAFMPFSTSVSGSVYTNKRRYHWYVTKVWKGETWENLCDISRAQLRKLHARPLIDVTLVVHRPLCLALDVDAHPKCISARVLWSFRTRARFPGVEIHHKTVWVPVLGGTLHQLLESYAKGNKTSAQSDTYNFPRT